MPWLRRIDCVRDIRKRRGEMLKSPKVYDMRAMDEATMKFVQRKFGLLLVNSSDSGVGIDEVMTIVSGGPYTWFFVVKGDVVGKLRLGLVSEAGKSWRISYPGLVPHGGFFDAKDGLVVAYAHGPESFVMRPPSQKARAHPHRDRRGRAGELGLHRNADNAAPRHAGTPALDPAKEPCQQAQIASGC